MARQRPAPTFPVLLLLLLLLLLSLATPASSANAAPAKAADKDQTITITGEVLAPGGQPAADAEITLAYNGKGLTATTDAAGRFTLEAKPGFVSGNILLAAGADGSLGQLELPHNPAAKPGASLDALRIELEPPRFVEVIVADADGKPAAGAEVVVTASYRPAASGQTDDAGRAALKVPQEARLDFVLATKAEVGVDYRLFRDPRQPKSDPYQLPHDHADPIALTLQPTRTVVVQAVDHEGRPVAGAEVHPWLIELPKRGGDANLGMLWSTHTDADGIARFPHIPANNENTVTFWVNKKDLIAAERTTLEPKATANKLTATLLPLVTVEGRVLHADGTPAANMPVLAAGDDYDLDDYREQTTTNANGEFKFDVYPDHYCLFAAGDYEHASPAVARIVRLGEPVEDVELNLVPATRIHGRLTLGRTDKPAADQYISIYQKDSPDYYQLPEDQRLPNPTGSSFAITPRIIRATQTDDDGQFEFFVGPGDYYLIANELEEEAPQFTITDQREQEFNLALRAPPEGKLTGRVVLASDPSQGIPEIYLRGYSEDSRAGRIEATTDAEGRFEAQPAGADALVGAFNEDKSLGGIVRLAARETELTLELAPTATARGTLIDEETGRPAAARQLGASIRVGAKDGPFMMAFEQSATTDENGEFEIRGLVPGHSYDVHVVTGQDADGQPRGWRDVGKAEPTAAGELPLGELRLPKPYRPPTVEDDIARAYSHKDPAKRLKRLRADAELAYGQVLIVAGSPDGKATRRYFEMCWHDTMAPNELTPPNLREFMVLAVDPAKAGNFFKKNNLAPPPARGLALAILNPDGSVVAETTAADLSKDGQLDAKLLAQFLEDRRAPLPSARRLLDEALAEATRDDKRVLVQVGGPGCGWCVVLARYLEEQKELIAKDYIHLKLDSRMPEVDEVIGELREDPTGGVPWMIILAADGEPLITSDAKDGNIGYPGEPESQVHWEKMLRETRQRLTDDDLAAILAPLDAKSP